MSSSRSASAPGSLQPKAEVEVYALESGRAARIQTLALPAPTLGNRLRPLLSPSEKLLAVLAEGELWVRAIDPKDEAGGPTDARRLYPPAAGEAPLGPKLSHAALSSDNRWALLQSPQGWARLDLDQGGLAMLPLPKMDLSQGKLALDPDGTHVLLVRPQSGTGFLNGANVIALNLESGFAQALDREHLYVDVLFLPNGTPLGQDVDGALWALQPQGRIPYFTPPTPPRGASAGSYAVSLNLGWLAYLVTPEAQGAPGNEHRGKGRQRAPVGSEVWVAGAPPPPRPPRSHGPGQSIALPAP